MTFNERRCGFRRRLQLLAPAFLCIVAGAAPPESAHFEDPADYPLMGDWGGSLVRPGVDAKHNHLAAQLICLDRDTYRLRLLPALNLRANPYVEADVACRDGRIVYASNDWHLTFENGTCQGVRSPQARPVKVEMERVDRRSPTLGLPPPAGAVVLFDGSSFDAWQHPDSRPLTWTLLESKVMETVSGHWNDKKNRDVGVGGSIVTKQRFSSMQFHMEFRYPVEPGKTGQKRGNSGLFISGFKEIQILNSYGSHGYWNECGALYRTLPPNVNATAPPLQWQTYDVEALLPASGSMESTAYLTVRHNGHLIHHRVAVPFGDRKDVAITLQDHTNALQFRNLWVKELKRAE